MEGKRQRMSFAAVELLRGLALAPASEAIGLLDHAGNGAPKPAPGAVAAGRRSRLGARIFAQRLDVCQQAMVLTGTRGWVVLPLRSGAHHDKLKTKNPPFSGYGTVTAHYAALFWAAVHRGLTARPATRVREEVAGFQKTLPDGHPMRYSELPGIMDSPLGFGICIITGPNSGLCVLDADTSPPEARGLDRFRLLCERLWPGAHQDQDGLPLPLPPPGVLAATSQGGGMHLYMEWSPRMGGEGLRQDTNLRLFQEDLPLQLIQSRDGREIARSCIDYRTGRQDELGRQVASGVIVCPPTIGHKGGQYRWLAGCSPFDQAQAQPVAVSDALFRYLHMSSTGHHRKDLGGEGELLLKWVTGGNCRQRMTLAEFAAAVDEGQAAGLPLSFDEVLLPDVAAAHGLPLMIDFDGKIPEGEPDLPDDAPAEVAEALAGVLHRLLPGLRSVEVVTRSGPRKLSLHVRPYGLRVLPRELPLWVEALREELRAHAEVRGWGLADAVDYGWFHADNADREWTLTTPFCAKRNLKKPSRGLTRLVGARTATEALLAGVLHRCLLAPGPDERTVEFPQTALERIARLKAAPPRPRACGALTPAVIDECVERVDAGEHGSNNAWFRLLCSLHAAGGTFEQAQRLTARCVEAGHPGRASQLCSTWRAITQPKKTLVRRLGPAHLLWCAGMRQQDAPNQPQPQPQPTLVDEWYDLGAGVEQDDVPGFFQTVLPVPGTRLCARSACGNGKTVSMGQTALAALLVSLNLMRWARSTPATVHLNAERYRLPRILFVTPRRSLAGCLPGELLESAPSPAVCAYVTEVIRSEARRKKKPVPPVHLCPMAEACRELGLQWQLYFGKKPRELAAGDHRLLVVQVESLSKLRATSGSVWGDSAPGPLLLLLDELESVLAQLLAPTVKEEYLAATLATFEALVRNADVLVATDGYLSVRGVSCLRGILTPARPLRVLHHTHVKPRGKCTLITGPAFAHIDLDKVPDEVFRDLCDGMTYDEVLGVAPSGERWALLQRVIRHARAQEQAARREEQHRRKEEGKAPLARKLEDAWFPLYVAEHTLAHGRRPYMPSGSRRIAVEFQRLVPEARVTVGGASPDELITKASVFGDPDGPVPDLPPAVALTPSVTVGVNWPFPPDDPRAMDRTIAYAKCHGSCGARDQVQQVMRARWTRELTLEVHFARPPKTDPATATATLPSLDGLRQSIQERGDALVTIVQQRAGAVRPLLDKHAWVADLVLWCAVERRIDAALFPQHYLHMLAMCGWEVPAEGSKPMPVGDAFRYKDGTREPDVRDERELRAPPDVEGLMLADQPFAVAKLVDEFALLVSEMRRSAETIDLYARLAANCPPRDAVVRVATLRRWLDTSDGLRRQAAQAAISGFEGSGGVQSAAGSVRRRAKEEVLFDLLQACGVARSPSPQAVDRARVAQVLASDSGRAALKELGIRAEKFTEEAAPRSLLKLLRRRLGYGSQFGIHASRGAPRDLIVYL